MDGPKGKDSNYMSVASGASVFEKSYIAFDPDQPELLQVGNFLIDQDRVLGSGEFGKVYLSQEIPQDLDVSNMDGKSAYGKSRYGDDASLIKADKSEVYEGKGFNKDRSDVRDDVSGHS